MVETSISINCTITRILCSNVPGAQEQYFSIVSSYPYTITVEMTLQVKVSV